MSDEVTDDAPGEEPVVARGDEADELEEPNGGTEAALASALDLIRDVADFPQEGVTFKDITPLLADPDAFEEVIAALAGFGLDSDGETAVDVVVGMESRGFIVGVPVAMVLGVGFVPVRKPGKLPGETRAVSYDLEYGSETLEMHTDALAPGQRVLIVDDVLATGGTARATVDLVEQAGAVVAGVAVVLELSFLPGRATLGAVPLDVLRAI